MNLSAWIVLAAMALLSAAVIAWRWRVRSPSRLAALAVTLLYCITLLLALRAGARTYPGIPHPESALLNAIFNNGGLFTELGYDAVLIAGAAAVLLVFLSPANAIRGALSWVKWASTAVALLVIGYGLYWAVLAERLPWMADGSA